MVKKEKVKQKQQQKTHLFKLNEKKIFNYVLLFE